jgi:hypothetical protein
MREHGLIIDALSRRAAEELAELLGVHLRHKYDTIWMNFDRLSTFWGKKISPEPGESQEMHAI